MEKVCRQVRILDDLNAPKLMNYVSKLQFFEESKIKTEIWFEKIECKYGPKSQIQG